MEGIEVRIIPEKELPAYHPGETIKGRIIIRVPQRQAFSDLRYSLFSEPTEGDKILSNTQEGTLKKSEGEWTAERDNVYKFALQVPAEPEHWEQRQLYSWYVRVQANVPEEFPIDEQVRIWVVAPGEERFLLQDSDEEVSEPGMPGAGSKGEQRKKTNRRQPAPSVLKPEGSPGVTLTVFLMGLVPLAFMVGGMFLALNGVPQKTIPGGIRIFGLLAMIGPFFVLRKIGEGSGTTRFFRIFNGLIALAVGLLGFYIALIDENFSFAHPAPLAGDRDFPFVIMGSWNHWMGYVAGVIFFPLAGYIFSGAKGAAFKMLSMIVSMPAVLFSLLLGEIVLTAFIYGGATPDLLNETPGLVICLIFAVWTLVKPEWRNAPFVMVLFSVIPFLLVAIAAASFGGPSLVLAAVLVIAMLFFLYMGSRNMLAQRHLGKVVVRSDPPATEILLGNTHILFVEFNPRNDVEIDYILAEWICEETVMTGTGTSNRRSDTSRIFTYRDHQARNQKLTAGNFFRQELSCMMLPSLRPTESLVTWRVEVKIVVKGKPDWDTVLEMTVKRN